jgi:hypothetical protein
MWKRAAILVGATTGSACFFPLVAPSAHILFQDERAARGLLGCTHSLGWKETEILSNL